MRVIFLHTAREWSGTARAFARGGRGLAARGTTVTMIAPPDSNVELGFNAQSRDGERHGKEQAFDVLSYNSEGFWYFASRRLRKLFRKWDASAVFVTTDREHLIAATVCWMARRGAVVRRTPAGIKLEMSFSGRMAARLAPTIFLFSNEADRHAAVLPKRAVEQAVAEIGIDAESYGLSDGPDGTPPTEDGQEETEEATHARYIVCVYDSSSRGRAATAVRCISMLAPRHPDLRLLIVGPGSDHEDLRMQASALRILHLVSFLGERDDQVSIMRDADLGWVVAEGDTAAYGILDLMALEKPLVASEVGVAGHYVANGISGTLYPADDSAATAATVAALLGHEESRVTMGRAARTRVIRDFPESDMIEGFARVAELAQKRSRQKS
ncbi:MAG: glycosyltransferase [Gemmatimonadaceae bacterium]|nr:glycosyltransferase [Gemmatimonadaceae bacterium]